MTVTCGHSSATPLAYWDRASSCWKTSQGTFLSEDQPSLVNLPKSGFVSDGWLYELPTLATAIAANACSSSASVPTPTSTDARNPEWGHGMTLTDFARELLPTPTTQDAANCGGASQAERNTPPLNTIVTLLPTPVANDDHKNAEAHVAAKVRSGAGAVITSLDVMTRQAHETGEWSNQLLPTPRASEGNGGGASR